MVRGRLSPDCWIGGAFRSTTQPCAGNEKRNGNQNRSGVKGHIQGRQSDHRRRPGGIQRRGSSGEGGKAGPGLLQLFKNPKLPDSGLPATDEF